VAAVLERQLPALAGIVPTWSAHGGDERHPRPRLHRGALRGRPGRAARRPGRTGATMLTCTLPDIAGSCRCRPSWWRWHAAAAARQRHHPGAGCGPGALCLDTWAMPGASDPGLFGPDRIHPNAAGHELMATTFADLLLRRTDRIGRGSQGPGRWVARPFTACSASSRGGDRVRGKLQRVGLRIYMWAVMPSPTTRGCTCAGLRPLVHLLAVRGRRVRADRGAAAGRGPGAVGPGLGRRARVLLRHHRQARGLRRPGSWWPAWRGRWRSTRCTRPCPRPDQPDPAASSSPTSGGSRRAATRASGGIAAAIKLTPGIFILFFLLTRRTKSAVIAAGCSSGAG